MKSPTFLISLNHNVFFRPVRVSQRPIFFKDSEALFLKIHFIFLAASVLFLLLFSALARRVLDFLTSLILRYGLRL
jgi:hypothetical protein